MVNLIAVTIRVLWRQVSSSAGFYSREVRNNKNNKKGHCRGGRAEERLQTLHSLCEGSGDCLVYSSLSSGQIFTQQFWGKWEKKTHWEEVSLWVFVELDAFCPCKRKEETSVSGGPGKRQFPGLMRWDPALTARLLREGERAPGFYLRSCRPELFQWYSSCKERRMLKLNRSFHFLHFWAHATKDFAQLLWCNLLVTVINKKRSPRCIQS